MFNEEYSRTVDVMHVKPPNHPSWKTDELISIFVRLLQRGWMHPEEMTDRMAAQYGQSLGHYGRLALEEQHARNQQHQQDAAAERNRPVHPLIRDLVNLTSVIYGVPGGEK